MKIIFRKVEVSDWAFVFATYIRNTWFDKANKTTLKRSTWSTLQHKRLEGILKDGNVVVACLSEDPDTILGYALMDGGKPYTYVKLDFRSSGLDISSKLVKQL